MANLQDQVEHLQILFLLGCNRLANMALICGNPVLDVR